MNRTQKVAWFNLAGVLVCIAIHIWVVVRFLILKTVPGGVERLWPAAVFCVLLAGSIVLSRRKQSPAEVESDERDRLIKYRAMAACFVSVWVLLAGATVIPRFVVGLRGAIPVWLLAFINLGVLLGALLVYTAAILVQYGREGKGGE
jgi:hypothetical protein